MVGPDAGGALRGLARTLARPGRHRRRRRGRARSRRPHGVAASIVVVTGLGDQRRSVRPRDAAPRGRRRRARAGRRGKVVLALPAADRRPQVEAVARARCSARTRSTTTAVARPTSAKPARALGRARDRTGRRREGRAGRARAGGASSPTRRPCPRPGQHPAERADPGRRSPSRRAAGARRPGSTVTVLDEKALRKGGYGGILGVGQGSANPPRLVRLAYRHPKATRAPRARRQGHHLRLRRHLHQAGGRHGGDEDRHGRRRRGARAADSRSPRSACRSTSPAGCRWPRTCRRGGAQRPSDVLTHVRRPHRRGAQHRRRGPARPRRRARRARPRTSRTRSSTSRP